MPRGLDTDETVFFYEHEFYCLSNFSSFRLYYRGFDFDTSEHAYQWTKFRKQPDIQDGIMKSRSAHEAFRLAIQHGDHLDPGWAERRVGVMESILRLKLEQHEYVARKLRETGTRELIENSWRDDYWGWGENRIGKNMLGVLWMKIRSEMLKS